MTPATPPNSRHKRPTRSEILPETPERATESDLSGLVTPGTVRVKDKLLVPTRPMALTSPCPALKTPEYTPHKSKHTKRRIEFDKERLQPVSRVLFGSDFNKSNEQDDNRILLPPKRTGVAFLDDEQDQFAFSQNKLSKQVPGTPSDKITTFKLASKWFNESGSEIHEEEEDDEEVLIYKNSIDTDNPFLSTQVADKQTREMRKKKLLEKDPDLETTITYVDKSGRPVSKRNMTPEEQKRFKPTRLFAKELGDQSE